MLNDSPGRNIPVTVIMAVAKGDRMSQVMPADRVLVASVRNVKLSL